MKFGDIFFGALALIIGGIALYSGFTFVGILFQASNIVDRFTYFFCFYIYGLQLG